MFFSPQKSFNAVKFSSVPRTKIILLGRKLHNTLYELNAAVDLKVLNC
jgi:hypothetical protein